VGENRVQMWAIDTAQTWARLGCKCGLGYGAKVGENRVQMWAKNTAQMGENMVQMWARIRRKGRRE
jgi:hypothetical protein